MGNKYCTNDFLKKIRADVINEQKNSSNNIQDFSNISIEEFMKMKTEEIQRLRSILRTDELEEKYGIPVQYSIEEEFQCEDVSVFKYAVRIADTFVMPVYVANPDSTYRKNVLYLHGHDSDGVRGAFTTYENKIPYHKNLPVKMAKEGYRVIAPELMGHGEAVYEYVLKNKPAKGECFYNNSYLSMCGYSMCGIRVWQTMKCLDFMQIFDWNTDVSFGVSGGGQICEMIGALDERIGSIVISSYVNTYDNSILSREHCVDNYVQNIFYVGDNYEILGLAAPKRMLLLNGNADRPFPIQGTQTAFSYIKQVYRLYQSEDRLQTCVFEGRHEIDSETVIKWLKVYVKNE